MKKENGESTIKEYLSVFGVLLFRWVVISLAGDSPVYTAVATITVGPATIGAILLLANLITKNKLWGNQKEVEIASLVYLMLLWYTIPTIVFFTNQGHIQQTWFWGTLAINTLILPLIYTINCIFESRDADKNDISDRPITM